MKANEMLSSMQEFEVLPVPSSTKNCLGLGSFGIVKLARHRTSNKKYALKIVNMNELECEAEIQSIKREIRVHSKLDHPHIVKFHNSFQKDNTITMVLEYAERGNLYSYLRKKKRLSEFEAYSFFSQTLKAISFLHENDILHRDLKPENLLLDKNYSIKLCDFGWCCEEIHRKRSTFCGTYEYMSPEVVFKKPYGTNIDVWSLGILLYELATGYSPFKAKNLQEITQKFKSFRELLFPDHVSNDLKNLITGILKMNPDQRMNISQILSHKWIKRMSVIKGNGTTSTITEVSNENVNMFLKDKNQKILEVSKSIDKKFQIPEKNRVKPLCDITDFTDQRFMTSPQKSIELSITRVRKPIFFDIRKKTEINLMDGTNSIYYNKTEYNRQRNSNNTNISNASFLNRTNNNNNNNNNNEFSVFKSIDNSKKHRIFLKEAVEQNPGKVLKTMENLLSQINVPQDGFIELKQSQNRRISKTKIQFEEIKRPKTEVSKQHKFSLETMKLKEKKENYQ